MENNKENQKSNTTEIESENPVAEENKPESTIGTQQDEQNKVVESQQSEQELNVDSQPEKQNPNVETQPSEQNKNIETQPIDQNQAIDSQPTEQEPKQEESVNQSEDKPKDDLTQNQENSTNPDNAKKEKSKGKLSKSAKLGLGLGLGIGIPVVAASIAGICVASCSNKGSTPTPIPGSYTLTTQFNPAPQTYVTSTSSLDIKKGDTSIDKSKIKNVEKNTGCDATLNVAYVAADKTITITPSSKGTKLLSLKVTLFKDGSTTETGDIFTSDSFVSVAAAPAPAKEYEIIGNSTWLTQPGQSTAYQLQDKDTNEIITDARWSIKDQGTLTGKITIVDPEYIQSNSAIVYIDSSAQWSGDVTVTISAQVDDKEVATLPLTITRLTTTYDVTPAVTYFGNEPLELEVGTATNFSLNPAPTATTWNVIATSGSELTTENTKFSGNALTIQSGTTFDKTAVIIVEATFEADAQSISLIFPYTVTPKTTATISGQTNWVTIEKQITPYQVFDKATSEEVKPDKWEIDYGTSNFTEDMLSMRVVSAINQSVLTLLSFPTQMPVRSSEMVTLKAIKNEEVIARQDVTITRYDLNCVITQNAEGTSGQSYIENYTANTTDFTFKFGGTTATYGNAEWTAIPYADGLTTDDVWFDNSSSTTFGKLNINKACTNAAIIVSVEFTDSQWVSPSEPITLSYLYSATITDSTYDIMCMLKGTGPESQYTGDDPITFNFKPLSTTTWTMTYTAFAEEPSKSILKDVIWSYEAKKDASEEPEQYSFLTWGETEYSKNILTINGNNMVKGQDEGQYVVTIKAERYGKAIGTFEFTLNLTWE